MAFRRTKHKEEADLIQEAIGGNAQSFGDLYEIHLPAIYQYVSYRVGSVHDAEDLSETVFLKAWQAIESYQAKKVPFVAWLYRIAHNTVVDFYRTQKQSQSLDVVVNRPDDKMSVEQETVRQDEIQTLMKAVHKLSELHQHVLVLRFLKGFSHAEVAEILDRRVEAVRVLQHRALKELQTLMLIEKTT